jgi:hypothetical protein
VVLILPVAPEQHFDLCLMSLTAVHLGLIDQREVFHLLVENAQHSHLVDVLLLLEMVFLLGLEVLLLWMRYDSRAPYPYDSVTKANCPSFVELTCGKGSQVTPEDSIHCCQRGLPEDLAPFFDLQEPH